MMKVYQKILEKLEEAGSRNVVPLEELLKIEGVKPYRISTYIWECKVKADACVMPAKDGRKVVGYQIIKF
jgi:hypothetical protein